ncbi:MAG: hypothetical protein ABSG51_09990 [Terracidiphilus sp.]|jgi:hypothetical protein
MTQFVPAIWSVWGAMVLLVFALKLYSRRLARDEDNQIILQESFDRLKIEQDAIRARVGKVEPIVQVSMWLALTATVFIIGYYAVDIANQFK